MIARLGWTITNNILGSRYSHSYKTNKTGLPIYYLDNISINRPFPTYHDYDQQKGL